MKVILEMCCAHEIRYLCFYFKGIIMISQVDYSYKLAVKKTLNYYTPYKVVGGYTGFTMSVRL